MFFRIHVLLWTLLLSMLGMTKFVTQQEAARFLGVTPRTIRNLISRGVFTGFQLPGLRAVRLDLHEIATKMKTIPTTRGEVYGKPKFNGNVKRVPVVVVDEDQ